VSVSRITHHATCRAEAQSGGGSRITHHAFSLIEVLVVITLLTVIILGLLAMFHQVQKAFREGMTQSDVLESGRAITDMLARDLEQIVASQLADALVNGAQTRATNFIAQVDLFDTASQNPNQYLPVLQGLPGNKPGQPPYRTNVIQKMFFMVRSNQTWVGTGYQVRPDFIGAGVGTLYRYTTNTAGLLASSSAGPPGGPGKAELARALAMTFGADFALQSLVQPNSTTPPQRMNRVADGIVHFTVNAFDPRGLPILATTTNSLGVPTNNFNQLRVIPNTYGFAESQSGKMNYAFVSNATPAFLEIEVGFLETRTLDRFKSMAGNAPAQLNYLSNHAAQVHLFRQRIPIRNVDFAAYQ